MRERFKLPFQYVVVKCLRALPFFKGPIPEKPSNPSQGENTLFLAFDAMEARDYTHAFTLFNEALEQGINDTKLKARALNMRGTFKCVASIMPTCYCIEADVESLDS